MICKEINFLDKLFNVDRVLVETDRLLTWTFMQKNTLMLAHRIEEGILIVCTTPDEIKDICSGGSFRNLFFRPPLYWVKTDGVKILGIAVTNPIETPVNVPERLYPVSQYIQVQYPMSSIEGNLRTIYLSEFKNRQFNIRDSDQKS